MSERRSLVARRERGPLRHGPTRRRSRRPSPRIARPPARPGGHCRPVLRVRVRVRPLRACGGPGGPPLQRSRGPHHRGARDRRDRIAELDRARALLGPQLRRAGSASGRMPRARRRPARRRLLVRPAPRPAAERLAVIRSVSSRVPAAPRRQRSARPAWPRAPPRTAVDSPRPGSLPRANVGQPCRVAHPPQRVAPRRLSAIGDPLVGRKPLGQELTDEIVTESIPRAATTRTPARAPYRAGRTPSALSHPERNVLRDRGRLPQGQPPKLPSASSPRSRNREYRVRALPMRAGTPGEGVAGKLQHKVRVSLGELKDPIDDFGVPGRSTGGIKRNRVLCRGRDRAPSACRRG